MIVQFVYQRAKLYREIAMGKSHHMVITQGVEHDYSLSHNSLSLSLQNLS